METRTRIQIDFTGRMLSRRGRFKKCTKFRVKVVYEEIPQRGTKELVYTENGET